MKSQSGADGQYFPRFGNHPRGHGQDDGKQLLLSDRVYSGKGCISCMVSTVSSGRRQSNMFRRKNVSYVGIVRGAGTGLEGGLW